MKSGRIRKYLSSIFCFLLCLCWYNGVSFAATDDNKPWRQFGSYGLSNMWFLLITGIFVIILVSSIVYFHIRIMRRRINLVNDELSRQHEWLKVTLSSIGDAVIATDENGLVTFINHVAQKCTGVTENEAVGRPIQKVMYVISEDTREPCEVPVNKVLKDNSASSIRFLAVLIARDGHESIISCSIAPIRSNESGVRGAVIGFRDISDRKRAEASLRWERDFSKSIIDNAGVIILIWKDDGSILQFNKFGETASGFMESDFLGWNWQDITQPADFTGNLSGFFDEVRKNGINQSLEWENIRKNGTRHVVYWNNGVLLNEDGVNIIVSIGLDVSEQREAENKLAVSYLDLEAANEQLAATERQLHDKYNELIESQKALNDSDERYRLAIEGSNDALWDLDLKTDNLFVSIKGKEMLGYKDSEISNWEDWIRLIHPEDIEKFTQCMNYYLAGKTDTCASEYRIRTKSGEFKWMLCRGKAIWDKDGNPVRMAGSHTDISERKKTEEAIHQLAYYDTLTGLPNRVLLMDRMNMALAQSRRSKSKVALLYIDLDNFKAINDTQGHVFGDELIKSVSSQMKTYIRESDTVSRLGGDEFVILQPNVKSLDSINQFVERILSIFNKPWELRGREFFVTASIGIAVFPDDGKDGESLLKNADAAMYKAKGEGKNNFRFYLKSMNDEMLEKLDMERNLRLALVRNEFAVYYQPQVDLISGQISGIEALIRWFHPTKGMISPVKFIPIAEETGLILPIGEWVLMQACKQAKMWQDAGIKPISVAVNLSARQFQQQDIVEVVKNTLEMTGLDPRWLELEITESIAMQNLDHTIAIMRKLQDMGIALTLDDFGTGYSSLNYLKQLPINNLKIDKAFVQGISSNQNEEAIAKAIIFLSNSLNLNLTAEGVETEDQLKFLMDQKCDKVQGFLFSKPLPEKDLEDLLRQQRKFC